MASNTSIKSKPGAQTRGQPLKKKSPEKKVAKKAASRKPAKSTERNNGQMILMLDPVLVINNASDTRKKFSSFLDRSDTEIVIDASLVEMIDTAMIQLLFSLISGLKSKNVEIVWRSPSSEFVSRVRSLGLVEIFNIDCPAEG